MKSAYGRVTNEEFSPDFGAARIQLAEDLRLAKKGNVVAGKQALN